MSLKFFGTSATKSDFKLSSLILSEFSKLPVQPSL